MLRRLTKKSQEVKPKAQADCLGFCKGVKTYVQRASLLKMSQKTRAKQLMRLRVAVEHMSSKLAMKIASAALAAFALASAVVSAMSASEEAQIQAITDAQNLWKDEFVALRDKGQLPQPYLLNMDSGQTCFAVTDLDGNGRLELIFRHAAVPTEDRGVIPRPFHFLRRKTAMAVPISIIWTCSMQSEKTAHAGTTSARGRTSNPSTVTFPISTPISRLLSTTAK